MRVLLSIAAVPVLLFGWLTWSERSFEHRLQPIASEIAGREIGVDCQSFLGSLVDVQSREGEVTSTLRAVPEPRIFLTRSTCKRLKSFAGHAHHGELDCLAAVDWRAPDPFPFSSPCYQEAANTIYAVLILAHESYHARGVDRRGDGELRRDPDDGVDGTRARRRRGRGRAASPARWRRSSRSRIRRTRRPAATPGSRFDLHPETPDFPTEHPLAPPRSG